MMRDKPGFRSTCSNLVQAEENLVAANFPNQARRLNECIFICSSSALVYLSPTT
jgi:hypothetical protein